jgi:hypothetical protein
MLVKMQEIIEQMASFWSKYQKNVEGKKLACEKLALLRVELFSNQFKDEKKTNVTFDGVKSHNFNIKVIFFLRTSFFSCDFWRRQKSQMKLYVGYKLNYLKY